MNKNIKPKYREIDNYTSEEDITFNGKEYPISESVGNKEITRWVEHCSYCGQDKLYEKEYDTTPGFKSKWIHLIGNNCTCNKE